MINVAMIGCGAISGIYLKNITETFQEIQLVGVCDLIPERAEKGVQYVKDEIENGSYGFDIPVNIAVLKDGKALYPVGEGRLSHCLNGFTLTGCGGKLNYSQSPLSSYSLNSDYYWYKIGDVIGIGNNEISYYCFPKNDHPVAKTRLAAEEMYKMLKQRPTLGNRTIC